MSLLGIRRSSMYMVTSLRSGLTWFVFPNWATKLSLVQRNHSGSLAMPRLQIVTVVILMGKETVGRWN